MNKKAPSGYGSGVVVSQCIDEMLSTNGPRSWSGPGSWSCALALRRRTSPKPSIWDKEGCRCTRGNVFKAATFFFHNFFCYFCCAFPPATISSFVVT